MAFDEDLAARIRDCLARQRIRQVDEKRMFGGVGFLLSGNMLVGVWKDSLVARLGDDGGEAIREPHVRPFDVTGKPMRGWVLVDPEGLETDDQLAGWITRAMAFVRTLPAK
jgi:hypothetical protein